MISANGIDFLDFVAECRCFIDDKLNEIMRGRFPRQELELSVDGASPSHDDPKRNLRASQFRSCLSDTALTIIAPIGSRSRLRVLLDMRAQKSKHTPSQFAASSRHEEA
jgi:hypothetical protein